MDFSRVKVPRKNQSTGKKSKKGRPIITVPSATRSSTERNYHDFDLSNDREDYNDRGTNDHIRDINNPGDGSDSSNFSDGDPARRRQQQQQQREDRAKKERRKRQQTKDRCEASQKQWDNKRNAEGYSLEDMSIYASKQSIRSFDGVRTDAPTNEAAAEVINSKHVQSLKKGRGKNHNSSAFANLEGSGSKRGRRENQQHGRSPFAGDGVEDPLDLASERQGGSNRKSKRGSRDVTEMMGRNMNNLAQEKYGDGSMTSIRNRKKKSKARDEVIDVDSDERIDGSGGKKRKTSSYYFDKSSNSSDSPSSLSVNQGDDGFYMDGDLDPQGIGGGNEEVLMGALDAAKEYVHSGSQLQIQRDPKKAATGKQKRRKCFEVTVLSCSCFIAIVLIFIPTLKSFI